MQLRKNKLSPGAPEERLSIPCVPNTASEEEPGAGRAVWAVPAELAAGGVRVFTQGR